MTKWDIARMGLKSGWLVSPLTEILGLAASLMPLLLASHNCLSAGFSLKTVSTILARDER